MGSRASTMMKTLLVAAAVAIAYVSAAAKCTKDPSKIPEVAIRQELCPASAPFFGFMGCAAALVFACLGAAYGTAKSGVGVANMGVLHSEIHHEVNHPHYHGGCPRYLRPHRRGAPRLRNSRQEAIQLRLLLRLLRTCRWPVLWYGWSLRWDCHRHRRGRWCACQRSSAQALRWCHPHSYLRRGSGSVRSHRGSHPVRQ